MIETILAQILIIILNYIFSKIYIFKGTTDRFKRSSCFCHNLG